MRNTNDLLNSKNTARLKHGGKRTRPDLIDELHDQWCIDNGYTSKHQQASKRSSTVDQRAGATNEQAKPSDKQSRTIDPGKSFKHP